jgi:hypothetical protein
MDYQPSLFDRPPKRKPFKGADYQEARDYQRLENQLGRIWRLMVDGQWRSFAEIAAATGDPENSISAQLRHLRKREFGSHTVERRHEGRGFYRYRLVPNPEAT